jgi:putative iron-regulated protein
MKFGTTSIILSTLLSGSLLFSGCDENTNNVEQTQNEDNSQEISTVNEADLKKVLTTYADIANAVYTDSVGTAKILQTKIAAFVVEPTGNTLNEAKKAWKASRIPYLQAEAFRLSNTPIDAKGTNTIADDSGALEGQLNAWPLDEHMIDYTKDSNGTVVANASNIINTTGTFTPNGDGAIAVDITTITQDALTALNENGGDANVATGYHAIEFLLWGQDPHDITKPTTAGTRPLTDYTTDENAQRRKEYLTAVTSKMVEDLETIAKAWTKDDNTNFRAALLGTHATTAKNLDTKTMTKTILSGLGVYIKSEVANERIAVAIVNENQEDEHSCFSDNTHVDITEDVRGFWNILNGEYNNINTDTPEIKAEDTTSFLDLVNGTTRDTVRAAYTSYWSKIELMNRTVANKHFDHQILEVNTVERKNISDIKNELRNAGDTVVKIAEDLGISLTADNVTDPDETKL